MSLRSKNAWKPRQQRKARINAELAAADQEERQKWVDRGPDTQPWTPEMLDRVWDMVTVADIRRRAEQQRQWAVHHAEQHKPLSEMRGWYEGRADAFTEVLELIDSTEQVPDA